MNKQKLALNIEINKPSKNIQSFIGDNSPSCLFNTFSSLNKDITL